ncbi:cytochrome P450 [Peziza echinospora]|nr:cytochrome P450 [Peziza echinospora]
MLTHPLTLPSTSTITTALSLFCTSVVLYFTTLIVYRLYLHPLAKYPGPFLAKITPMHASWHAYKGDRHLLLYRLHKKYGPIVRWGPNSVSINSATAVKDIYGHGANARNVVKSDFYMAFPAVKGVHNTHNAIDKSVHGRKRRVLSQAFSENALKGLEGLVLQNIELFFDEIQRRMLKGVEGGDLFKDPKTGKKGLDMGEMFNWLTFDVMGELCFGKAFGMLVDEKQRFVTGMIDKAAHNHYICGNYLPLTTLKLSKILFPTIAAERWRFILHSRACANERMELHESGNDTEKRDFFHYLLNAVDPETGNGFDKAELWGEANVLMIAGSDTTSTALAATLYYLLQNPAKMAKLQAEIRSTFSGAQEIVSGKKMTECVYLRACIDEAMRLCPPVPGLLPREVVSPAGMTIDCSGEKDGAVYTLPQGTVVGVPIYAIHHNPLYFPDPFTFMPERWIESEAEEFTDPEVARSAYLPFSIGSRGCIGKSLALMELRLVIARVAWEWECTLLEGVEGKGERWVEGWTAEEGRGKKEFPMQDHFTARKEGPVVEFRKREVGLFN